MFCKLLFVLLAILLFVLPFTDSDYPFGIFKFFLEGERCCNLCKLTFISVPSKDCWYSPSNLIVITWLKKLTFDIILTASSSIVNSTTGFAVSAIFRNTTLRPTTKIKHIFFVYCCFFFSFCIKQIFFFIGIFCFLFCFLFYIFVFYLFCLFVFVFFLLS